MAPGTGAHGLVLQAPPGPRGGPDPSAVCSWGTCVPLGRYPPVGHGPGCGTGPGLLLTRECAPPCHPLGLGSQRLPLLARSWSWGAGTGRGDLVLLGTAGIRPSRAGGWPVLCEPQFTLKKVWLAGPWPSEAPLCSGVLSAEMLARGAKSKGPGWGDQGRVRGEG